MAGTITGWVGTDDVQSRVLDAFNASDALLRASREFVPVAIREGGWGARGATSGIVPLDVTLWVRHDEGVGLRYAVAQLEPGLADAAHAEALAWLQEVSFPASVPGR